MAKLGFEIVGDADSGVAAFNATGKAALAYGDTVAAVAEKTAASAAAQRAKLTELAAAYRDVAAAAAEGSDEQVAAASLAERAEARLATQTTAATAATDAQTASLGRASTSAATANRGFMALGGTFSTIVGVLALDKLAKFGESAVESAASVQTSQESIQKSFGSSSDSVISFGNSAATSFGISAAAADSVSAKFGILFNNVHIGSAEAAQMTIGWEQLAGAISKIKGVDPTQVLNAMTLAAAGNSRGLKQLGIVLTTTAENQKAANDGFGDAFSKLSAAQKATVIYQLATANLGADLDEAKTHTHDLTAEQQRLTAEWQNAKDTLGNDLAPALQDVVGLIDKMATAFSDLPGPVKSDIEAVTAVLAVGAPLLLVIAGVVRAVKTIGSAFGLAATESTAATGVMEANMAGVEASAVAAEGAEAAAGGIGIAGGLARTLPIVGGVVIAGQTLGNLYNNSNLSKSLDPKLNGSTLPQLQALIAKGGVEGSAAKQALAYVQQQAAAGNTQAKAFLTGGPSLPTPSATPYGPPAPGSSPARVGVPGGVSGTVRQGLSQQQQLAIALAANPNDPTLLQQKADMATKAIAFLKANHAKEGISNAAYVTELQGLYADQQSALDQIQALHDKAVTAAKATASAVGLTGSFTRSSISGVGVSGSFTGIPSRVKLPGNISGSIASKPYSLPLSLQLAAAKASATASTSDDRAAAQAIKAYDDKLLASHKLSLQSQIDVYNNIAAQNSVLGTAAVTAHSKIISAAKLASELGVGKAGQEVLAQVLAHGGHVPTGIGLQGIAVGGGNPLQVHTSINLDGKKVADAVSTHQIKTARHTATQRRGPHAGL